MANTASSEFSAVIGQTVQTKVLVNLRADLVWANSSLAESGTFNSGDDTVTFISVPDLSNTTPQTPITEGTAPTRRKITMSNVSFSTTQYADIVDITDVAKVKAPFDVINIASERVARTAQEVIDVISRDAVFTGGTAFYAAASHTTRATLDSSDKLIGSYLIKLRSTMKKAKVPTFPDNTYHLYVGPSMLFDLKSDTTATTGWAEPGKYTQDGRTEIMSGEVGKLHGFRIMEVNNTPSFASTTTVGAALATGPIKGWGAGELQTLRAYHIAAGGDHTDPIAQIEEVGWKVNFGVGVLSNSYFYRVEAYGASI